MLYLHFCSLCQRIHILSGHRKQCPACAEQLLELSVSYEKYIRYTLSEREVLLRKCMNSDTQPKPADSPPQQSSPQCKN